MIQNNAEIIKLITKPNLRFPDLEDLDLIPT
jgi:hypothetical protein